VLKEKNSIAISEELALKLFGTLNVLENRYHGMPLAKIIYHQ
jgi:hypothetical protein